MLTIADVQAIPLFSTLAPAQLDRLAQSSADLHLEAGEWAVHEGGERALYAVLAGKIEVVKLIDGVERRLGWRLAGTIFGEVPIALGTPFPADVRSELTAHGHHIIGGRDTWGGFQGILIDPKTHVLMAGSDPRKDGMAAGW